MAWYLTVYGSGGFVLKAPIQRESMGMPSRRKPGPPAASPATIGNVGGRGSQKNEKGVTEMRKPTISDIALVLAIVNLLWIVFCEFILPRVT
nr:MAG TPA: hypothetical protein [Caudoviricetes sp.]